MASVINILLTGYLYYHIDVYTFSPDLGVEGLRPDEGNFI